MKKLLEKNYKFTKKRKLNFANWYAFEQDFETLCKPHKFLSNSSRKKKQKLLDETFVGRRIKKKGRINLMRKKKRSRKKSHDLRTFPPQTGLR